MLHFVSFQVLRKHLARALQKKWPEVTMDDIVLHQDNVPRPHGTDHQDGNRAAWAVS